MELDKNIFSKRQVIVSWAPSTVYQNSENSAGPFAEGRTGGGGWGGGGGVPGTVHGRTK